MHDDRIIKSKASISIPEIAKACAEHTTLTGLALIGDLICYKR